MGRFIFFGLLVAVIVGAGILFTTNHAKKQETTLSTSDVRKEAREAVHAVSVYSGEQLQAYKAALDAKLEALNQRLTELQAQIDQAASDTKEDLTRRYRDLQEKAEGVRQKLTVLRQASGEAWDEAKPAVEKALEELDQAVNDVWTRVKKA